jgi:hypothetical protein
LNTWYRNHPQTPRIKTIVYCEKEKLGGVLVVNETTADPGIKGGSIAVAYPKHRELRNGSGRQDRNAPCPGGL